MTTLLTPRPTQRADRPLSAAPRACDQRLVVRPGALNSAQPAGSAKKMWVLAASVLVHVGLFAALAQVIVRPPAAPAVAMSVAVEFTARILPADGESVAVEGETLDLGAAVLPAPRESVPLTGMQWSPADVKLPELPGALAPRGEVIVVEPSSLMSFDGYWTMPAGMGDGPDTGVATNAPATPNSRAGGGVVVRYLRNPRPAYPREAVENGWEGTTVLDVEVLTTGTAGEIAILESSGHEVLDQAALTAVHRWRFIPARQNDVAVVTWVEVPVRFALAETGNARRAGSPMIPRR